MSALGTVVTSYAGIGGGYIHKDRNLLVFIRITQTGSNLSGFLQVVKSDYSGNDGVVAKSGEFVGTVSGTSFALQGDTLNRLFGSGIIRSAGTIKGKSLSISFPVRNGFIATQEFTPCTEARWNQTLTEFTKNHRLLCQQTWLINLTNSEMAEQGKRQASISDELEKRTAYKLKLDDAIKAATTELEQHRAQLKKIKAKITETDEKQVEAQKQVDSTWDIYYANQTDANGEKMEQARADQQSLMQFASDLLREEGREEWDGNTAESNLESVRGKTKDNSEKIDSLTAEQALVSRELRLFAAAKKQITKSILAHNVSVATAQTGTTIRRMPSDIAPEVRTNVPAWFVYFNFGDGWNLIHLPTHELAWIRSANLSSKAVLKVNQ